jgi:hypothetical protein
MAVTRVKYTPSRRGFALMMNGPEIRTALGQVAEKAKRHAVSLAGEFSDTGHYAGSFVVVQNRSVFLAKHWRASALLVNTASYAAVVEFGRKGKPGHRVLGRTLDLLAAEDGP